MAKAKKSASVGTFEQKQSMLRKRKRDFSIKYRKGVYFSPPGVLANILTQPDLVIRCHESGVLDDNTQYINISIEGFKTTNPIRQWLEQ